MSATNSTTNYSLPLFVPTDKPAWLVDWNGAMSAIDTAIKQAQTTADSAGTDIGTLQSDIANINAALTTVNNAVSQLRLDTNSNTGAIHTIQELIGNGTPTTTDKTLIGAINELNADISDIEDLNVYTSTEQIIGQWIDGKTICRRVLEITTLVSGSADVNVSSWGIDKVINLRGSDSAGCYLPCNVATGTDVLIYSISLNFNDNKVQIRSGQSATVTTPVYVIVEYTKTTT